MTTFYFYILLATLVHTIFNAILFFYIGKSCSTKHLNPKPVTKKEIEDLVKRMNCS